METDGSETGPLGTRNIKGLDGNIMVNNTGQPNPTKLRDLVEDPEMRANLNKLAEVHKEAQANDAGNNEAATVTMSTGVIFHLRPYSRLPLIEIGKQFKAPDPPSFYDEEHGVTEVNVQDPDYLEALMRVATDKYMAAQDYMIMASTWIERDELESKSIEHWDGDQWTAMADYFNVPIGDKPITRYLSWCKMVAIGSDQDLLDLVTAIQRRNGVREEDVQEALATFRSDQGAGSNSGLPNNDDDRHGDQGQSPHAGNDSGDGRDGSSRSSTDSVDPMVRTRMGGQE